MASISFSTGCMHFAQTNKNNLGLSCAKLKLKWVRQDNLNIIILLSIFIGLSGVLTLALGVHRQNVVATLNGVFLSLFLSFILSRHSAKSPHTKVIEG